MKLHQKKTFLILLLIVFLASFISPFNSPASSAQTTSDPTATASISINSVDNLGLDLVAVAPSYQIEKIEIEGEEFDFVSVPGTYPNTESGKPELPKISTLLGVPSNANVTLEIVDDSIQEIQGDFQLSRAPFPARLPENGDPSEQWDYQFVNNTDFVNTQVAEPYSVVKIAEDAWIRDQRIVRIEFSPFEYDPQNGQLIWHPHLSFRVNFTFPAGEGPKTNIQTINQAANQPFEALLQSSLLNYEQSIHWRTLPTSVSATVNPPDVGNRYRIAINADGIYQLNYEELVAVHPEISGANPQRLTMTNQGEEIAIQVIDGNGNFGPGDSIIFYGQRFYGDRLADLYQSENLHYRTFTTQLTDGSNVLWKPKFNEIMLEKYTHENIYWLYEGTSNGLRMSTVNGDPTSNSNDPVPHYRETIRAEKSTVWSTLLLAGEDTWFWERILIDNPSVPKSGTYTTTVSARATAGDPAIIRAEFISTRADSALGDDHHTKVYFNNVEYDDFTWSGKSRYHFEHTLTPATILDGVNSLKVEAHPDAQVTFASYYFDWFEIEYNRLFQAAQNQITFSNQTAGTHKYQVDGFSSTDDLHILDISNPLIPRIINNPSKTSSQATISLNNSEAITVSMSQGTQSVLGEQISYFEPPSWDSFSEGIDYVFITHSDLLTATENLATYRETTSGLSTLVLDIDTLYNEFNFGIFNPIAIKNFLSYTFANWDQPPTFTLLVGDGHWNFHEYNLTTYGETPQFIPPNLAWVDPWQYEVDSANILATVVGTDPLADVMIARLPVNSENEITAYLNKISNYEAPHTTEAWERNHLFIADNADSAGNFKAFADAVINDYVTPSPFADEIRIYQDDYGCTSAVTAQCQDVRNAITNTINITGSLIVNFVGHASLGRWSHERVFTPDQFTALTNNGELPVILSMDCLDGYWSGPSVSPGSSMIEMIVRQSDTGAIAAFSPTGLGVSTGHDILHKGFYDALMSDGNWGMGLAAQNAKLWLYAVGSNPDLLHTYTTFGDPALEIRNPFDFTASPIESYLFTDIPGTVLTHQIKVENTGATTDQYLIEVTNSPGWTVTLPYTVTAQVTPGNEVTIPIQVQTPNPGSGFDIADISITSKGNRSLVYEGTLKSEILVNLDEIFLPLIIK